MSNNKIYPAIKETTTTTTSNCVNIFTTQELERKNLNNNNKVLVQAHIPVEDLGRKTKKNSTTIVPVPV